MHAGPRVAARGGGFTLLAKLILVVTMAASAFMGGTSDLGREEAAAFDGYYLYVDALGQPSLWQETNQQAGLQTGSRTFDGGLFLVEVPPDNRVLL